FQHIRPDYLPDDILGQDWRERLLARFLVDVDRGDGWGPMPCLRLASDPAAPLPGWADGALADVLRVRILFPVDEMSGLSSERRSSTEEENLSPDSAKEGSP
ncbi:MAG: hypothetical protein MUQ65_00420, partial [Armatimonadetes bacterium]|nr:hypothetical protein [Armatimonadota bacterium]